VIGCTGNASRPAAPDGFAAIGCEPAAPIGKTARPPALSSPQAAANNPTAKALASQDALWRGK
jgi:hypothetical protein